MTRAPKFGKMMSSGTFHISHFTGWVLEKQEALERLLLVWVNTVIVGHLWGFRHCIPPLLWLLSPHRVDRFVLLMTPSRYNLIEFALGNWWHTDTPWCWRRGPHARGTNPIVNIPPGQIRYCYWSLTTMRGCSVCVWAQNNEESVGDEWWWQERWNHQVNYILMSPAEGCSLPWW